MSITIVSTTYGTITLDDSLSWIDRPMETGASGNETPTLGSRVIIQRLSGVESARVVTLSTITDGGNTKGIFTTTQRDQLMVLRNIGEEVEINYHGDTFDAVISMDGILLDLFDGCVDNETDNLWAGAVTFITV